MSGLEIARRRIRAGYTRLEFARLLGVSPRTVEEWETGRRRPTSAAQTLIEIAFRRPDVLREITLNPAVPATPKGKVIGR